MAAAPITKEFIRGLPNELYHDVIDFLPGRAMLTVVPRVSRIWRDLQDAGIRTTATQRVIESRYPQRMLKLLKSHGISLSDLPVLEAREEEGCPDSSEFFFFARLTAPVMRWSFHRSCYDTSGIVLLLRNKPEDGADNLPSRTSFSLHLPTHYVEQPNAGGSQYNTLTPGAQVGRSSFGCPIDYKRLETLLEGTDPHYEIVRVTQ